jgi:hypothetical protein
MLFVVADRGAADGEPVRAEFGMYTRRTRHYRRESPRELNGISRLVFSEGARKMDATYTALPGQNTTVGGRLYTAFGLGEKNWKLSLGGGQRAPSRFTVAAGDTAAVLTAIARARCHLTADTPVYGCYEGRPPISWWIHIEINLAMN